MSLIRVRTIFLCVIVLLMSVNISEAVDSDSARQTLTGINSISVTVEDLPSDIQKYAPRFGLTRAQLQSDIEKCLGDAGITVLNSDNQAETTGRSILYVNVNTNNYQKYWYSYTVSVQIKQVAPSATVVDIRTLSDIWSVEMTGTANIGTLNIIKDNVKTLVGRFVAALQTANRKDLKSK